MSQSARVPAELASWIDGQIRHLTDLVTESKTVSDHDTTHQAEYVLGLLTGLSEIETTSRRLVHLLTTYALRNRIASPTVVAKRTKVTITAAQNRAGSALAQEVWNEVWPPSRTRR